MNSNNLINDYFSKIYSGNVNEFNKFINNNNLSINITNKNKENALHVVIKSDLSDILKVNFIKYLISKNINFNDKDSFGNTPFNLACQKQLFNIMLFLYNKFNFKINLYDKNNYNLSPIYYILKGQIVDELEDYPSPIKFIKNESSLKINDVSKLLDAVKDFVKNQNLFIKVCENLIKIIKKNINFELQINKSLIDIKINEFKKKITKNKNNLSADFKYEFYKEIFNIIKKSHPKTFEPINFESTKALDYDGFYLKKIDGTNTDFKIHGEPTFGQNLANVEQLNLIDLQKHNNKYKEIISSLDPRKFFFPFLEEIAHIYYCREFLVNINKLYNSPNECRLQKGEFKSFNQLNDFIEYINSLSFDNKVIKIASGRQHNLVLTSKGQVYSFGSNNNGECGHPIINKIDTPTLIDGTGDIQGNNYYNDNTLKPGKIKDIACGRDHSLILNMKGQVFAFGDNYFYQLGDQNVYNLAQPKLIENSDLFINEGFISIACGDYHNLLLQNNGSVFTFGDNTEGQLGRQIANNDPNPTRLLNIGIIKIACGANHSMMINQDGRVFGFGDNNNGQTGVNRNIDLIGQNLNPGGAYENNSNHNNLAGVPVVDPLPIKGTGKNKTNNEKNIYGKIIDIACGLNHTMILNDKGEVYSFGLNDLGQLGFIFDVASFAIPQAGQLFPVLINQPAPQQNTIDQNLYDYIIDNSPLQAAIVVGGIPQRQNTFFDSNNNNISQPLPITDTLKDYNDNNYKKIKSIACGANHSMIITEAGEVFSFGDYNNNNGKLGLGNLGANVKSPQRINGTGYSKYGKIISASAGREHSLILNKNGNVFSFGNSKNGRLGIQPPPVPSNIPQIIDNYNPLLEPIEPPEELDPEYIIRDNKLFKNFTIKINNLQNACLSAYFIYIKNIVTNDEIFIYNKEEDALNTYEIIRTSNEKKSNNSETLRNLSLEITYNNKLELKLNNKTLGTGQFEIKFYNNNFNVIKEINIKTNEYNELINVFFGNKLNDENIYSKLITPNNFNLIHQIIKYYNDNLKIDDFSNIINYLNKLKFPINETYFDRSKFNINYREKILENINNYKSTLLSAINEFELFGKSKLNKKLIKDFDRTLKCDKVDLSKFSLSDDFNEFLEHINKSKKLVDENFDEKKLDNDFVSYTNAGIDNYLISPAYQDFYYYFRYHILEKIITDELKYDPNKDDIKDELNKIFEYYDYDGDDNEIYATKLAVIGDILDHLLINKIRNVIFNEINAFVKDNTKFELEGIETFDMNLINMNNEFDLDLSKMNDKIKKILQSKINNIKNELEYNLGNVLINNVEVQPVLYYPNNFFDINFNKQQFILYNKELKDRLGYNIKLDYDLTKSLIENQNNTLIENLKQKIILDNHKIGKLIDYIQKNKIDNNIYNYSDFCENYKYHLEEELKKIQNHKNIFKYYKNLIDTFIYFYKNEIIINLNSDEYLKEDLSESVKSTNKIYKIDSNSNKTEIKEYSKTNIIKSIINKVNLKEIYIKDYDIKNLEKMLIESRDVDGDTNSQLKKEFISICLAIDLIVGNMYSKLLKRFLLEYLTDKYSSEIDDDTDLNKLKIIISNIMTNVDKLINTNFDFKNINFTSFDLNKLTEFTKKLVILHSEGRYKIKEYVELNEDNLFNEIVNLIKSNSYEKIEEDDIVLTYLKDNINDYFKKYYKIAIKTLIACSSGLNNYILYHNKFNNIKETLKDKIEDNNKILKINKKAVEKKIEEKKKNVEEFSKKNNDTEIQNINNNFKNKIKSLMKKFKS